MARVLVIEDNPTNLQLMVYLLRAFGHTPLEAVDGAAGLERAGRDAPDLIICDIQIPKMDGYEVCRQVKSDPSLRAVPVVAVTALAMVGDRDAVLAAGFDGYIAKPIDPRAFVGQAEAFLGHVAHIAPVHWVTSAPRSVATTPPAAAGLATILVADDAPPNRTLVSSILESVGYRVLVAASVSEALGLLERSPPDLVLSALPVPEQGGLDLLQAIQVDARWRELPVVVLGSTAWPGPEPQAALARGARRFIQRPIDPQQLLTEIEACLQDRSRKGGGCVHHSGRG